MSVVLVLFPTPLVAIFGANEAVLAVGGGLMLVGAFFQVFDAVAMVALGILRGAGATR